MIDLYGKGNIHNINTTRYESNKSLTSANNPQQKQLEYFKTMIKYMEPSENQKNKIRQREIKQIKREDDFKQLLSNIDNKI